MRERSGSAGGPGAPSRPGGRCRGSPSPPCPDGGRSGAERGGSYRGSSRGTAGGGPWRAARTGGTGRDATGRGSPSTPPPKAVAPSAPRRRRSSPPLPGSGSAPPGAPRPSSSSAPPPPRGRAGPGRPTRSLPRRPPARGLPGPAAAPGPGEGAQKSGCRRGGVARPGWEAGAERAGGGPGRGTPAPRQPGSPEGRVGILQPAPPPPRVVLSLLLSSFGSSSRVGGDHRWGDPSPCPSLWENSAGMGFLTQSCLLPGVLVGLGAWEGWRDGWRMPSLGGMEGWMESTCAARPKTQGRARALATAPRDAQRPQIPWCCGADTGGSGMPFLGMAAVLPYAAGSGPGVGREAR